MKPAQDGPYYFNIKAQIATAEALIREREAKGFKRRTVAVCTHCGGGPVLRKLGKVGWCGPCYRKRAAA